MRQRKQGRYYIVDATLAKMLRRYQSNIPVPVVNLARELGLKVFLTKKFPDKKSGEIVKEEGSFSVYLNANHPYARNRFTLAHEIAHYMLHRPYLDRKKEIEDFVGTTYSLSRDKNNRDLKEWEADMLAGDILMPEAEFVRVWNDKKTVAEVAAVFDVSEQAAYVRAKVLAMERQDREILPQAKAA